MQPPSLPDISVIPGSPVLLSSPIVPVSTPSIFCWKVEVLKPLDWPLPRSCRPRHAKTPYAVTSLSPLPLLVLVKRPPSPPLVVSPIIHHAPTISIPPQDTPIPILPTLRKRARCEPLPSALPPTKKQYLSQTSFGRISMNNGSFLTI